MPQHYSRATVEVSVWCKVCGRATMHRVDDRRRGPCLECIKKREREHQAAASAQGDLLKKPDSVQMDLFNKP